MNSMFNNIHSITNRPPFLILLLCGTTTPANSSLLVSPELRKDGPSARNYIIAVKHHN